MTHDPDGHLAPMDLALADQPPIRATAIAQPGESAQTLLERLGCTAADRVEIPGGVPLVPLIDEPLIDPSIARGPDGIWWLTGTSPEHPLQVRLWSSLDLTTWNLAGLAWDLAALPEDAGWMRFRRLDHRSGQGWQRNLAAPELSHHRGAWWLTVSVNGQGTALLRCDDLVPTGTWHHHARLTTRGGDASLFVDDDGSAWWVWDGGWIAPLDATWQRLTAAPRLLQPEPHSTLGDAPLQIGTWGARLQRIAGCYVLTAADRFGRLGEQACADTFVAVAASALGPYSRRRLLIPHGDQACLFERDGQWLAAISPTDPTAALHQRPAIVPLTLNAASVATPRGAWAERTGMAGGTAVPEPVRLAAWPWSILERTPRARYQPIDLPGIDWIRDPQITTGPDGWYYVTGTTSRVGLQAPGLRLWRSRDLAQWQAMGDTHGVVWYADAWEWCSKPQPCRWAPTSGRSHRLWGGALTFHGGYCYLSFQMSSGGSGLLRSRDPAGPWEPWWYLDQIGIGLGLFSDTDGAVYRTSDCTTIQRLREDLTGPAGPKQHLAPASGCRYGYEGGHLLRINGWYALLGTDWNGTDVDLEGRKGDGTYDTYVCLSRTLHGPYGEPRLMIPHSGALFQTHDGRWMATCFGNGNGDISAPLPCRLAIVPMIVDDCGNDLHIRMQP